MAYTCTCHCDEDSGEVTSVIPVLSIGDHLCSIHFYLKHFALGEKDQPAKKEEVPSNYLSFISLV